jgi:hypothetical protein
MTKQDECKTGDLVIEEQHLNGAAAPNTELATLCHDEKMKTVTKHCLSNS